jgi:CubicO group peptidase (beta-lactamase class C family)
MKIPSAAALLIALLALTPFGVTADTPPTASDLRLMVGAPPPPARRVNRANFTSAPFNRWSLQHARELLPTRPVACSSTASPLPEAPVDLDNIEVKFGNEEREALPQWLKRAYTDAIIVLHDGKVVYERYFNDQAPDTRHLMFSVTKSFTGTLALMLIEQGKINPKRQVSRYVDELTGTAFGDATVQQLLDMTNSIDFDETYTDPESDISRFAAAFGWGTTPDKSGGSVYTFLQTLTAHDPHYAQGEAFHYVTADSEVLGWIIRRVTHRKLANFLADTIWKKLGAGADGYYVLDPEGTEMAGGGLNITLRDAARFGQMILDDGRFNGQQIVPAKVAQRIKQAGNHDVFGTFYKNDPWYQKIGWAYHDQWWTFNNEHKAVAALGVYGQYIYIDPVARVVIVKQTSDPDAEGRTNDVEGPLVMNTIAEYLQQRASKGAGGT